MRLEFGEAKGGANRRFRRGSTSPNDQALAQDTPPTYRDGPVEFDLVVGRPFQEIRNERPASVFPPVHARKGFSRQPDRLVHRRPGGEEAIELLFWITGEEEQAIEAVARAAPEAITREKIGALLRR